VIGLDCDPKILKIAKSKVAREGLSIVLDLGMTFELPYYDNSFDRVKVRTLKEIFRVIRPGGEFHLADFGKPHNALMYLISLFVRNFEETSDNIKGLLPEMFRKAGFIDVEEKARYMTITGTHSLYRVWKPG